MSHVRGSRIFASALAALSLLAAALVLPAGPNVARAKGGVWAGEWAVLSPVSYKNLTIFPVRAADLAGSADYVTLDEGTKAGTVVITEKGAQTASRPRPYGASGAAARQQNVSYGGGGASVNELALVNRSGKKLLLLAGEVVVGGKQDRIVQEDRVIPPVSVPVALNVFCVEHGRWSPRATAYNNNNNGVQRPVNASGRNAVRQMGVAPETGPVNFSSLGALAHPKLRAASQDRKEQSAVWDEVRSNNAKLGTSNGTDTYQEVYANTRVAGRMEDYVRALEREVLRPGVVGVVVARNGRPVWADVFASQRLFASYWPKLLKSYVVDAMGDDRGDARPTVKQARAYLSARDGRVTTATEEGVYQLVKTEQAAYAVFELRDISLASPLRLHFNKMDR